MLKFANELSIIKTGIKTGSENIMVSEINRGNNSKVDFTAKQQNINKTDGEAKAPQQGSTPKAVSDAVTLTPQAQQLKGLQKKVEDSTGFDQKKVDKIKAAILSGEYKVNVDRLAEKLANHELDLFG